MLDVIVLGGGPGGAVAARALALAGLRVGLFDQESADVFKVGEGLPPAARPLLRSLGLGLLARFEAGGHLPSYGNSSAWGSPELLHTDFIRDPNGHGFHLDRARFDALLREAAAEAGAEVRRGAQALAEEALPEGGYRISMSEGGRVSPVEASAVIDCTGRASWFARRRGVERLWEDHLLAFVVRWQRGRATDDEDSTTLIESAPEGWWYTALLPAGDRVAVYLTDPGTSSGQAARSLEGFVGLLQATAHVRERTLDRGYAPAGEPAAAAAGSSRLAQVTGDRWIAAGDAATAFDPLSSQGILAAMSSGKKAAEALASHLGGDAAALEAYERQITRGYEAYRRNRQMYYGLERRWPESAFWARRGGSGASG